MTKARVTLLAAALTAPLAACGSNEASQNVQATSSNSSGAAPAPGQGNVAALIAGNGELDRFEALVTNAGVANVLGGVGPYTVFAPTNAALNGLGPERVQALSGEAMRPQAAALLRAHMVPGALTRRDLAAALDRAGGRPVRMTTMAGNMLTFARDGEAIIVSSGDGARARLAGQEGVATNGAVQPIDGILVSAN